MVDKIIQSVESFAPIQQGAAASQNLIKFETELEKRKQQLRQQGVMLTPEKPTTTETGSATSSGHKPGDLPLPVDGQEHQHNDQDLTKLDSIPEDTLKPYVKKLNGQSFPVVQAWCKTFKKRWEPLSTQSLKSLSVKSLLRLKTTTISSQRTKAVSLPLSLGYRLVLSTRWELSPLDPRWHWPQSWQPDAQID